MKKQDGRKLKADAREFAQKKAIELWKKGHTRIYIAEILGVHKVTVGSWIKIYQTKGSKGLRIGKRGRPLGACRTLNPEQEAFIQKTIQDKMPDQIKLPFALWTRRAIQTLIQDQYKLKMPIRSIGEYLRRWGYTPQKPIKRAYEQNPKKVKAWLETEYPRIEARAKAVKAEIHWGDETAINNECHNGRSYSPRGVTPEVRRNACRFSKSMISSVSNQGTVRFMCYDGAMNSAIFIRFMRRLIKHRTKKVFLIVDNLKVHHSGPVKKWLEDHDNKIELYFLPAYTPERNPDEYLNRDLKQSVSNMAPARNSDQLQKQVKSFMRGIQRFPRRIKLYFTNRSVRYASN